MEFSLLQRNKRVVPYKLIVNFGRSSGQMILIDNHLSIVYRMLDRHRECLVEFYYPLNKQKSVSLKKKMIEKISSYYLYHCKPTPCLVFYSIKLSLRRVV